MSTQSLPAARCASQIGAQTSGIGAKSRAETVRRGPPPHRIAVIRRRAISVDECGTGPTHPMRQGVRMTESINPETGEPTPGIVGRLARDDVERKRFLTM